MAGKGIKGLRWWVVGLVALATVINYIDRQAMGVLWPDIGKDMFPGEDADGLKGIYRWISVAFILSYASGQAIFGKVFDKIGTRLGFALSIGVWSIATALHAFARGLGSFAFFRGLLGVAEAGNWPGAAKANAEWFPTKERAFAQGLFNSGAALGGIIAIPLIAALTVWFSWKAIFIIVGLTGLLWLVPWMFVMKASPEKHPWLTDKERKYILSGQEVEDTDGQIDENDYHPTTGEQLGHKESWGVIIASAAIDPIWWLFVFWIPIYLNEVYGMNVKEIGLYGWVPYVGAMLGAWFGGLLAQNKLKSGWSVDKTRKRVINLGCIIMLPALLAMSIPGKPSVLSIFGVNPAIATEMAEPGVKELMGYESVKELLKEEDFAKRLAGKDVSSIAADAGVVSALALAKEKAEANVAKLIEAEATKEEIASAQFNNPSKESLSALSRIEELEGAKNVAATISVLLMALILFGFQTAIGNVQTLPSDMFSKQSVGTLAGLSGMAAKLGAFGLTFLVPWLTKGGNYSPAFITGAALALITMLAVWFLIPKVERLKPKTV